VAHYVGHYVGNCSDRRVGAVAHYVAHYVGHYVGNCSYAPMSHYVGHTTKECLHKSFSGLGIACGLVLVLRPKPATPLSLSARLQNRHCCQSKGPLQKHL
jgi:hypothetical protein